ncbi:hypothetical protein [Hymenobacter latericus]|uniref:hypothetical protein n=1 Tax=Hymenobacter sp. YIM 151858-1 TaxID=2987688 RepID=UPI0022267997|nr:hypothetical protein [Hymenobacter sp. YIM 151858-1]UYZ60104.1 hypothetical protein OIS50_04710 [Hymenobacter sp. YIM 151858-1]
MTRAEIEALPAEDGWGKWMGLVGWADTTVERWAANPEQIWVFSPAGPRQITAQKVERWKYHRYQFTGCRFGPVVPNDERRIIYTAGEYPNFEDYTLASPDSKADLKTVYATSREDLCRFVTQRLTAELKEHKKVEQQLRDKRKLFKAHPNA